MKSWAVFAATATSLAALAGANVAAASPIPDYTVTCVNAGTTVAQWKRARVSHVTIDWLAADGTTVVGSADADSIAKQPKGQVIVGTAFAPPAQAQVTFTLDDGTQAPLVTVDCTS